MAPQRAGPRLVQDASEEPLGAENGTGGGNGNGGLTRYRLNEQAEKLRDVERKVDDLRILCTAINTKLESAVYRSDLWKLFGGTAAVLVLTLVGHIVLRSIG